jgi:hypothetical protein
METGKVIENGIARWCESCNTSHGFLYPCQFYDNNLLKEVKELGNKFKKDCESGNIKIEINNVTKTWNEWCK